MQGLTDILQQGRSPAQVRLTQEQGKGETESPPFGVQKSQTLSLSFAKFLLLPFFPSVSVLFSILIPVIPHPLRWPDTLSDPRVPSAA